MSYIPSDDKALGLNYEQDTIQAVLIEESRGKSFIKNLISYVKPLDIQELQGLAKKYLTISALPSPDLLVRRLKLKLNRPKDIDEAFIFQAEPLIPFPLEQAILDKIIAEKDENGVLLTFFAANKKRIEAHLQSWQDLDIDPEIVTAESNALVAFTAACSQEHRGPRFIVALKNEATLCILTKEDKLLAAHTIDQGVKEVFKESESDSLNLEVNPYENLIKAIQWNYLALLKETKIKETPSLSLVGEGTLIAPLWEALETSLGLPKTELKSFDPKYTIKELQPYATALGAALSALPKFEDKINLRKGEFSFATPWKRFKKPLMIYAGLSFLLSLAIFFFGLSYHSYKENNLKQEFISLLSLIQKPYNEFENQYASKFSKTQNIIPISLLKASDIELRLDFLEKELRSMPDTFPLLPNTPRVSDLLAWLSTHPALKCQEEASNCPSFIIDTFHYSLTKRPELNKKNEKYQVKVDLEFTTSSPRIAREFHDALIAPNDFIDPKGEIKWNATRGKYRTSFYLKDKTSYPGPLKEA